MNKKLIGHNQPPAQLDDFLILDADGKSTGRIKFTNTIIQKYLIRKLNSKQEYLERIINDSEKIGLKAKINLGGSKSFYYKYDPKGKTTDGKRRNPIPYHLGNFPEMKVDAARSLVEDLKQAIKLGQDPRSVIKERRKA
jgi:hypothetical protein